MIPQPAFNRESLAARLTAVISNPRTLQKTALCAGRIGMRTAAENLADLVVAVAGAGACCGGRSEMLREAVR
jgi:UDP-N-acetylglucosamine--N-acetylmuramyl-(pentapeptide) pyrophosphoryl-undecaprenol N-acetylglucosamine transferase